MTNIDFKRLDEKHKIPCSETRVKWRGGPHMAVYSLFNKGQEPKKIAMTTGIKTKFVMKALEHMKLVKSKPKTVKQPRERYSTTKEQREVVRQLFIDEGITSHRILSERSGIRYQSIGSLLGRIKEKNAEQIEKIRVKNHGFLRRCVVCDTVIVSKDPCCNWCIPKMNIETDKQIDR